MSAAPKFKYQITPQSGFFSVKIGEQTDADGARAFLEELSSQFKQKTEHLVVHCEHLTDLHPGWIRSLATIAQQLKSQSKQVRLISTSEDFLRFLKREGVDSTLKSVANIKVAMIELGLVKEKSIDVNFINPFLTATIKTLETQSATKAIPGQVYSKQAREKFLGDISGVIGLVSEAFTGSVVISFPEKTFLAVMSRMLGEEFKEVTKEIEDGAGELTNIIFGQAKIVLNEKGFGIKTALPSVVTGQQHSILQMSNGPRVVIPFETDVGPFFVEICTSGQ